MDTGTLRCAYHCLARIVLHEGVAHDVAHVTILGDGELGHVCRKCNVEQVQSPFELLNHSAQGYQTIPPVLAYHNQWWTTYLVVEISNPPLQEV